LFQRIQAISGIKLSPKATQQLGKNTENFQFVYPDIMKISAKVKDMNIIAHAEGMSLFMQAMQGAGEEGDRLFTLAMQKFQHAISSTLDNDFTLKSWGDGTPHTRKRKKKKKQYNTREHSLISFFFSTLSTGTAKNRRRARKVSGFGK
jgi:hypothetical protein